MGCVVSARNATDAHVEWNPPGDEAGPNDDEERDDDFDGPGFADPGGRSALRAAGPRNPRNLPCPTCGEPDKLTPADRARGYQCDGCADSLEGYGP